MVTYEGDHKIGVRQFDMITFAPKSPAERKQPMRKADVVLPRSEQLGLFDQER